MEANAQPAPSAGKAHEAAAHADRGHPHLGEAMPSATQVSGEPSSGALAGQTVPPKLAAPSGQRIQNLLPKRRQTLRVSPVLGYETDRYRLASPFTKFGS